MAKVKIIKGAKNKIKKVLKRLELSCEVEIPRRSLKYLSPCKDKEGNYLFFKARMTTNPKVEQAFKNEILLTGILNNYFKDDSRVKIPALLTSDFSIEPEWVVFEAIKGKHTNSDRLNKNHILKIVSALLALRKLPVASLPLEVKIKGKIKRHGFWKTNYLWYLRRIRSYLRFLKDDIDKDLAKKIISLVKNSQKILNIPKSLSHGDFSLVNLFFTKKGLIVVDWEHTRLDLPVADLAHIYVKTLRFGKSWAQKLVREYFKKAKCKKEEKIMFQITAIRYALRIFKELKIYYEEKRINKKRRDELMVGIPETLEKAVSGFEDLISS